jgi:hypothetical protein
VYARRRPAALLALLAAVAGATSATAPAEAAPTLRKSIWGPVELGGRSQFPIYRELGVGIFQSQLRWDLTAPTRPRDPKNPADPAYRWPPSVDKAIAEGRRHGITVALQPTRAPGWANGGRSKNWAPRRPEDLARFVIAASRRYPRVRHWIIWGEPTRRASFMPLARERYDRRVTRREARGPRVYAKLLDASYSALKRVRRRNLVIGGNTFTTGDITPRTFIRAMRLPNGRPPRMDLYGHNPFSNRRPNLRRRPLGRGLADFSDLDQLARWVDGNLGRRRGRRLRLFLSEFYLPTDHRNHETNFFVTHRTQASWLRSALRITRRWRRIYTLGWIGLYDDPPRPAGDEVNRGLINRFGRRKAAFYVFRDG